MSDAPIERRRFTDREVRRILRRAAEESTSGSGEEQEGMSLAQLKAIGAEVGIPPARMEAAARTVALRKGGWLRRLFGIPSPLLSFERTAPGAFDPRTVPQITGVIRGVLGQRGEFNQMGEYLEWSHEGESGHRLVTLFTRGRKMTIRASANLTGAATLTYFLNGLAALLLCMPALIHFLRDGSWPGLVLFLAAPPLFHLLARTILRKIHGRESDRFRHLLDELMRVARGPGAEGEERPRRIPEEG